MGGRYYVPNAYRQRLNPLHHFIIKNTNIDTKNSDIHRRLQILMKNQSHSASNTISQSLRNHLYSNKDHNALTSMYPTNISLESDVKRLSKSFMCQSFQEKQYTLSRYIENNSNKWTSGDFMDDHKRVEAAMIATAPSPHSSRNCSSQYPGFNIQRVFEPRSQLENHEIQKPAESLPDLQLKLSQNVGIEDQKIHLKKIPDINTALSLSLSPYYSRQTKTA